jgi:hypothetical protein
MAAYTRRSCIYCMLTAAARAATPRMDTKNQPRPRAERLTSCEHARGAIHRTLFEGLGLTLSALKDPRQHPVHIKRTSHLARAHLTFA